MKKSELFFSALQVPVDYVMLIGAGVLAFYLRRSDEISENYPILYEFTLQHYLQILLVVAAFFLLVFAIDGLYDIRATRKLASELYRVFRAVGIGLMLIIVAVFINRDWYSSRFVILAGGGLSFLMVSLGRLILKEIQSFFLIKKGLGVHRLVMVGCGGLCISLKREIKKNSNLGYRLVAHLEKVDLEKLEEIRRERGIDDLIECSLNSLSKKDLIKLRDYCIQNKITFKYIPALIETSNFELGMFLGEPLIEIKNTPLDGWGKIIKRIFDIVGAIVGIILFGPLMILIALAIWLESGRPIIFFNERVGHRGNFNVYKFRYMKREYSHGKQFSSLHNKKALEFLAELIKKQSIKKGPVYKIKNDPRKTRLGAFLERFSLDELPQFFNVIKGDMSLVGPRPHQPMEVAKYEDYQKRVLTIKPGITGMAQVSGRSDLSFEDEVRLDTFYIENWSLWLDIQLIIKTIPTLFKKRRN